MRCKNQFCRKFTPPKMTEAHQVFLNVKPHCTSGVEAKELLNLNEKKSYIADLMTLLTCSFLARASVSR